MQKMQNPRRGASPRRRHSKGRRRFAANNDLQISAHRLYCKAEVRFATLALRAQLSKETLQNAFCEGDPCPHIQAAKRLSCGRPTDLFFIPRIRARMMAPSTPWSRRFENMASRSRYLRAATAKSWMGTSA